MKLQDIKHRSNTFRKMEVFNKVQISPTLAKDLLSINKSNRRVRQYVVDKYAQQMSDGNWQWNGDSIKITVDGNMIDGQHKCYAIIKSGVTIPLHIQTGLPEEAYQTIDDNCKRTAGDTVAHLGFKNTNVLANLIKWIISYDVNKDFNRRSKEPSSNQDVATYLESLKPGQTKRIETAASKASGLSKKFKALTVSQAAFFHWLLSGIDQDDADQFIYLLTTGDGVNKNDRTSSILLLRDRLVRLLGDRAGLDVHIRNAFIIKAWNSFRQGRIMKSLNWTDVEDYPVAK